MNILLTGGTGFIGRHLVAHFQQQQAGIWILTRQDKSTVERRMPGVQPVSELHQIPEHTTIDLVINLAGAPLFTRPWTRRYREIIEHSRLDTTQHLVDWINQRNKKPDCLISGSAVGYYGDQGDHFVTEQSHAGDSASARLCQRWEEIARQAESNTRVILIRTAIVLGNGGALATMKIPFQFGLGSAMGSGDQYWSWIHINDLIRAIEFLAQHQVITGAVNLSSPHPVRQREFAQSLANTLNRPLWLPAVPGALMNALSLGGTAAMLESARAVPEQLEAAGFEFEFSELDVALQNLLG
jgi:uncharacterized protein (TIGR01777 family)